MTNGIFLGNPRNPIKLEDYLLARDQVLPVSPCLHHNHIPHSSQVDGGLDLLARATVRVAPAAAPTTKSEMKNRTAIIKGPRRPRWRKQPLPSIHLSCTKSELLHISLARAHGATIDLALRYSVNFKLCIL